MSDHETYPTQKSGIQAGHKFIQLQYLFETFHYLFYKMAVWETTRGQGVSSSASFHMKDFYWFNANVSFSGSYDSAVSLPSCIIFTILGRHGERCLGVYRPKPDAIKAIILNFSSRYNFQMNKFGCWSFGLRSDSIFGISQTPLNDMDVVACFMISRKMGYSQSHGFVIPIFSRVLSSDFAEHNRSFRFGGD